MTYRRNTEMTEEQFNKDFQRKVTTKYFCNRRRTGSAFNPYAARAEEKALLRKRI